jgi:phytoene dehydrogenase-like protein
VVLDELRAAISKVDNHNTKMAALLEDMISNSTLAAAAALRRVVDAEVFLDAPWDLSDLSAKFGFEAGVGEGDRWIVGGYKQLLERLADGVQVDLEWPVTSIEGCDASGNTVRGSRGESATAAAVIVTAPVNLLRAGGIAFQPPLPEEHRHALDLLIGGRAEKVALQFETCWWPALQATLGSAASTWRGSMAATEETSPSGLISPTLLGSPSLLVYSLVLGVRRSGTGIRTRKSPCLRLGSCGRRWLRVLQARSHDVSVEYQ